MMAEAVFFALSSRQRTELKEGELKRYPSGADCSRRLRFASHNGRCAVYHGLSSETTKILLRTGAPIPATVNLRGASLTISLLVHYQA